MATVKIPTSRFGEVEVEESRIIQFVSPILGFEKLSQYILLDHAENSPFKWLQAVGDPNLAFVVTNPKLFDIPYEFSVPEGVIEQLAVKSAEDVIVFTIVNIPNDNQAFMTANLLAPIIIHQETLKAMQLVLQDTPFNTRTRLLPDMGSLAQSGTSSLNQGKE